MSSSFKDKLLSKSNQFNYYKNNHEKLLKENQELKEKLTRQSYLKEAEDNNVIRELLSGARSFSNWKYIDYYFKDDFDELFHNLLKNMSPESKRRFKLGLIRAIMGAYTYQNTLYSKEEIELNQKIKNFKEINLSKDKICDFNILPGNYNITCFMEDSFTDKDKIFLKDKDIIDAGAFIGDSALPLSKLTSKNVYAFEPFEESFNKMKENIKLNNIDNIIPINSSLSDKTGNLTLYLSGDNIEGITPNSSIRKYDEEIIVKSKTIDEFVEENNLNIGLIKIDVEGGEQSLLKGAINTIKSQKPIIYVSIYHTADDFFNIKPWIENLNLGYEFEISKEKPYSFITDTVLECRVNENKEINSEVSNLKNLNNYDYKFSIIMAVYNAEKFLKEAIDSVINQTIGFEENIELILVDDGSTDNSSLICKDYQNKYPNNIKYIYQNNQGQATARNNGIKLAKGAYLNFLDSDDKFTINTFENVYNFIKNDNSPDIISIPIKFFDRQTGDHVLNYKYKQSKVVDLFDDYNHIQLSAPSSFVKSSAIKNLDSNNFFDTNLIISEDSIFINRLLLNNPKLGLVKDATYMYRKRLDLQSTIDKSTQNKDYYIHRTNNYLIKLIDDSKEKFGFVPKFIQFTIMYELQWLFKQDKIEKILPEYELNNLYDKIKYILSHIEDNIILEQKQSDNGIKNSVFIFKYGGINYKIKNNKSIALAKHKTIDILNEHKFYIDSVEIRKENFIIIGFIKSFFNSEDLAIELVDITKNKSFQAKEVNYESRDKTYIGKNLNKGFNFEIKIPINQIENSKLKLKLKFKDNGMYLNYVFQEWSNISFESNYLLKDNYLVKFEDNTFLINKFTQDLLYTYESENITHLESLNQNHNPNLIEIINLRKDYLKYFHKFNNKKIYLFMDRIDNADDNAEALYNYGINQKTNIEMYFILSKNSKDYERLKKWDNLIEYGSYQHKLLYLFADKIISSHPDEEILNPFYGDHYKYITGLCTLEKHFLQHGVTLHNVSSWLHRYDKHLSSIVCVSKKEYNSFLNHEYNYDKEIIQLLGFPRYDYLENKPKKQIVIMPTWRRYLNNTNKEKFKTSNYCKKLSSLLSNKTLIKHAKDKGYAIIFKPHINIMKYMDCFDINEYVNIDYSTKYSDIFNNSAIMITDYSSVAFDFAYLKKPIFYYHWDDKEYHFDIENSYFDYETMAFGKVLDNEEDLISEVFNTISNNVVMEDKYIERVGNFFEFNDNNNCKRVWDYIIGNGSKELSNPYDSISSKEFLAKNKNPLNNLISIIIPVYNTDKYIRKSLESILNQTIGFENLEVICVNDGSTDNSLTILKEYGDKYNNIKVFSLENNSGSAGKPRNVGLSHCTSDYIMFLDSDDYLVENACEVLYNKINSNDYDIVFGGYSNLYSNGKKEVILPFKEGKNKLIFSDTINDTDLAKVNPAISSKIFRISLIKDNNINFPIGVPGQDLVFVLNAFFSANKVLSLNNFNVYYRLIRNQINDKSISFEVDSNYMIGLTKVYSLVLDICKKYEVSNEITSIILVNHLNYFSNIFLRNNFSQEELNEIFNSNEFKMLENNEFIINSLFKNILNNLKNKKYDNEDLFNNIKF